MSSVMLDARNWFDTLEDILWLTILVFIRFSIVAITLPGVSSTFVSIRLRLVIALILSHFISLNLSPSVLLLIKTSQSNISTEVIFGTTISICIRTAIFALQILGSFIAQLVSLSQILGPSVATDSQSSVSNILVISGIVLVLSMGLIERSVVAIHLSYITFPPGSPPDLSTIIELVIYIFSHTMDIALQLSAPFMLIALYYNAILAIVNRAMPQLLVSFIGVPAILLIAILLIIPSIKIILEIWSLSVFNIFEIIGL